ncbi:DUF6042 family protein [Streptomyces canus]|uniref:DUF6042 family protein n=1 Tax=Streptomyces canus TaxID=58343 RepID=UPI00386A4EC6
MRWSRTTRSWCRPGPPDPGRAAFDPAGVRQQQTTTSLDRLPRVIDGHPHHTREAVRLLLEVQDFTAATDISALPQREVFRLRCGSAKFDAHRMRARSVARPCRCGACTGCLAGTAGPPPAVAPATAPARAAAQRSWEAENRRRVYRFA